MRVFEETVDATCAIMSEEKGLNGTTVESCSKIHLSKHDHSPTTDSNEAFSNGGRLKFFKDGKFILELSHRKEGEKMSWTPVPKKTYWPPSVPSTSTANNLRVQESTPSLSVSDDNSSVQSSPWQRDHCWKQNTPRKAANVEMTFVMLPLPRALHIRKLHKKTIMKKRRRPYEQLDFKCLNVVNGVERPVVVKTKSSAMKTYNSSVLDKSIHRLWENLQKQTNSMLSTLWDNVQTVHKPLSSSPRKRIVRDLEKVTLGDEQTGTKHRQKVTARTTSKRVSSYSIVSLLGKDEPSAPAEHEPSFLRNLLRSPKRDLSPEPRPKSRKNSPTQLSPSPESTRPSSSSSSSSLHPHHPYHQHMPLIQSPMMYSPFYSHQPPGFSSPPYYSNSYRGSSHAMWVQYPMSSLPRSGSYPGFIPPANTTAYHWGSPHTSALGIKKEESDADVPLNLSKHPG